MYQERRIHPRRRHLRKGQIVFRNGCGVMDCIVLDLSESGAKLQVADWLGIPALLQLRLKFGETLIAEVRHRTPETIGIRFIGNPPV